MVSTLEQSAGFATTICSDENGCLVPDKYTWVPDGQCIKDPTNKMFVEHVYLNDGKNGAFSNPIPDYNIQGYSSTTRLTFNNEKYGRETEVDMQAFAMMQSTQDNLESKLYSGFLGLGSGYSADT